MDCPQCGGSLATYALRGREASVCEDCGYVGIAAEHRGDPRSVESWDDALRRFYRAHGSDGAPSVELKPPLSRPSSGPTGESWDDALRRFYARRGGGTSADGDDDAPDVEAEADDDAPDVEAEADAAEADEDAHDVEVEADAAEADGDGR